MLMTSGRRRIIFFLIRGPVPAVSAPATTAAVTAMTAMTAMTTVTKQMHRDESREDHHP